MMKAGNGHTTRCADCGCPFTAHVGSTGGRCASCGVCRAWRRERDEVVTDREIAELLDADGKVGQLSTEDSDDLLNLMLTFEERVNDEVGWDKPPTLATLVSKRVSDRRLVGMEYVPIPVWVWSALPKAADVIAYLAHQVKGSPEVGRAVLGTNLPAVGAMLMAEGWVRERNADPKLSANDHPELRADECRFLVAVDIDGRQYCVMRTRSTGDVETLITTSKRVKRDLKSDDPFAAWIREQIMEGWSPVTQSLRTLVQALSTMEAR